MNSERMEEMLKVMDRKELNLTKNYTLEVVFNSDDFTVEKFSTNDSAGHFDPQIYRSFHRDKFSALFELAFVEEQAGFSSSLRFLSEFAHIFVAEIVKDPNLELNRKVKKPSEEAIQTILSSIPFAIGSENIDASWIENIWKQLAYVVERGLTDFSGSVQSYFQRKNSKLTIVGRLFFHLVEVGGEDHPFSFLASYSTTKDGKVTHISLKSALDLYQSDPDRLDLIIQAIKVVAKKSDLMDSLVESGEIYTSLAFDKDLAYQFLKEIPIYEEAGIVCRIPNWWKRRPEPQLSFVIGDRKPSSIGINGIVSFRAELRLGGIELTEAELVELSKEANGLSLVKGQWVEIDSQKLRSLKKAFDTIDLSNPELTLSEAMQMQLGMQSVTQDYGVAIEVTNGEWLGEVQKKLANPEKIRDIEPTADFLATLRPYQLAGLNWLNLMRELGFGALLADDMGLGKTVQVLAFLDYLRSEKVKTLLVVPASLVANWQQEAKNFAPKLKIKVIKKAEDAYDQSSADLFIITYQRLARIADLNFAHWDLCIIDEAQAIKNSNTKQSKAVKYLLAETKIALTGTPIENHLSDFWSIFEFLNRGMLGTRAEFRRFTKKLDTDLKLYDRIRKITQPFILRRLKTDQKIISDLPEKVEINNYTELTKKQVALYLALVKKLKKALYDPEPLSKMKRRGLVLSSLIKFKQICNHPAQYLGQTEYDFKLSGKFKNLAEICETIKEKRERVLIFTQFREITDHIADFLTDFFGQEGLVMHGGTSMSKREKLIDQFNGEDYIPFMVLSLKVGGVGLNLTSANHVIHFDRWWNPAVEDQATDRAFRIGQKNRVMVHKFVTVGTIEEKIAKMLEDKKKLSDQILAPTAGESWITELGNEELLDLIKLDR